MGNKSGQIFELVLFLMTVAMCGTVIMLYSIQHKEADNSLVSPRTVLETRDSLEVFEIGEKKMILDSLAELNANDFRNAKFVGNFKNVFLEKLKVNDEMLEFIFSNLTREVEARAQSDIFLNSVYSVENRGGNLVFKRANLEKSIFLRAENDNTRISFPVDFSFNFEKKYLISYEDNKFKVEEE